jgi:ABC-type sugar transport system substrate-binding protein
MSAIMKPRILVSLLDENQEFQRREAAEARAAAAAGLASVEVLFAENNAIVQIQQLFRAVHSPAERRPDAVIVETVTGEGLERVARSAVQAGVAWALLNRKVPYIADLRAQKTSAPVLTVSTDQVAIGRIQERQLRALLPREGGQVLYIQGPADTSAAIERLQGAREILAGLPIDLKVLDGDWTQASGARAIEGWLRLKSAEKSIRIDAVVCQNDAMAAGARKALLSASPHLQGVPVTGVDGLPGHGQQLVDQGILAATVQVPSNAGRALSVLVDMLRREVAGGGEDVTLVPQSYPDVADLGPRAPARERRSGTLETVGARS